MRVTRSRAIASLVGTLATPSSLTPASAQAETLRIAMPPIEPACLLYYAQENDYLQSAGLRAEISQTALTPAIVSAVVSGTYDIGYATVSTLVTAHAKGLPFVIIAPDSLNVASKIQSGIVVAPQSTIQSAKDFNGITFGTPGLNTLAEYLTRAWVDKHGGDSSTMKFVEIPFPQVADALAAGRIQAGYLVEPFITIAEKRNIARFLVTGDDAVGPSYLASAWFSTTQWAQAHPNVVARFAQALAKGARWANANPVKVVPIIVSHLNADPGIVASSRRTFYGERVNDSDVQPLIDMTAKYGKFTSFPASEIVFRTVS
jgi:ABC-type nitrate/sulfonate/bicarbonate transport system substrate-binding protein